ncbi:MAG: hypothetical protein OEN01_02180 [Candidatus Krumholzibacteria bacterium]|nr:hypothetical protein [Candidatus Krumholzibacteria bacterium]
MKIKSVLAAALLVCHVVCQAGTLPREPEADNGEYLLDVVTNAYAREWRDIWDAGDNRFRFRMGSNSVEQWFIEEELKFSTDLSTRLRLRYHHARFLRNSSEQISTDTFEFEGKFYRDNFLSVFATPTRLKGENSIGVMLQNRHAVNRFTILFVEFPQFLRNFSERNKNGSDSLLSIFTDKPLRLGLDVRERLGPNVWLRLAGEYVPAFEMADEIIATGQTIPREQVTAKGIGGWLEYVLNSERPRCEQTATGLDLGYRREQSTRLPVAPTLVPEVVRDHPTVPTIRPAPRLLDMEFDGDLYDRGRDDSVDVWLERRIRAEPYARVTLSPRYSLQARLRLEERRIEWQSNGGERHAIETDYVVPALGLRIRLGSRLKSIVEVGFAAEFRKRRERVNDSALRTAHNDHRLYFAYDYVFGSSKIIRITEAIELDSEDRGQFRIHDHGFLQMIFGF